MARDQGFVNGSCARREALGRKACCLSGGSPTGKTDSPTSVVVRGSLMVILWFRCKV